MADNFYRALEDKFRESRQSIKDRLRIYLPWVESLKVLYAEGEAIDLGCGRGEWLELLGEHGLTARGVDLDEGMLAACRELGLAVENRDAISSLKALADDSQLLVSAFHLVEHLSFDALRELVSEALRVLKPAGLLILETPNPENLVVGTANFYLDPTHLHPIPPQLLAFVPDHAGYCRTKILRLNEATPLSENINPTIFDVIAGCSPDVAVVAQKEAEDHQLKQFDVLFGQEYGLTLDTLAMRYEAKNQDRYLRALELSNQAIESSNQAIESSLRSEAELRAVLQSKSWKMTRPLRTLFQKLRLLQERLLRFKASLRRSVGDIAGVTMSSGSPLRRLLNRFPRLESLLRRLMNGFANGFRTKPQQVSPQLKDMSCTARRNYSELKAALTDRAQSRSDDADCD